MASVTFRKSGSALVRAYVRADPTTGKPIYVSINLPAQSTPEAIEDAKGRAQARADFLKGHIAAATVATAVEDYLAGCEAAGFSPATVMAYRSLWRRRIKPEIGSIPLDRVKPSNFAGMYRRMRRELAPATVKKAHAFLSGCFSALTADGVLEHNPMAGMRAPGGHSPEARPLDDADLTRLVGWLDREIDSQEDWERYMQAYAVMLALQTGARRGELAALEERDLRRGRLMVRRAAVYAPGRGIVIKSTKSAAGRRAIDLSPAAMRVTHVYLDRRDRTIPRPRDSSAPLLAHEDGAALRPGELSAAFRRIADAAGLPKWAHLHTLRHTHATYLLEGGANPREVQQRLGHSSVTVTMGIYGHVLPGRGAELARGFDESIDDVTGRKSAPVEREER